MIISKTEFVKVLNDDNQGFSFVVYLDQDGRFRLTLIRSEISNVSWVMGNMKGEVRYFSAKALKSELLNLGISGSIELYI